MSQLLIIVVGWLQFQHDQLISLVIFLHNMILWYEVVFDISSIVEFIQLTIKELPLIISGLSSSLEFVECLLLLLFD